MAVKQTMTIHEMANDLLSDEYALWSRSAAYGIAEYLDSLSDECGMDIEWDRVAVRCDYSEYDWDSILAAYGEVLGFDDSDEPTNDEILEALNDHTSVAYHDDETIVIAEF